ncbi:MAG TPA: plastocyanin/azurin family copper-binding protein [Acidimicrobiia bacterium]|nr:plastocyanin/azurin family copper-binding protein [Acidimicrobiia bacterium]
MRGRTWRVWALFGLVAAGIALPGAPSARAATAEVTAGGTRFTPPRVEIEAGDSVVWEATDDRHTVTSRDGLFDSSPRGFMGDGDAYRFRFRLPGRYAYFCRVHQSQGMQGEVVVVDPSAPTTTTTRLTPVSAAATSSSTATTTTAPTTTTTRQLATSSTTSRSIATATTAPTGTPAAPQEPPALNPNTPVVGSPDASGDDLPGVQAAARTSDGTDGPGTAVVVGVLAALGIAAGTVAFRTRPRRSR